MGSGTDVKHARAAKTRRLVDAQGIDGVDNRRRVDHTPLRYTDVAAGIGNSCRNVTRAQKANCVAERKARPKW